MRHQNGWLVRVCAQDSVSPIERRLPRYVLQSKHQVWSPAEVYGRIKILIASIQIAAIPAVTRVPGGSKPLIEVSHLPGAWRHVVVVVITDGEYVRHNPVEDPNCRVGVLPLRKLHGPIHDVAHADDELYVQRVAVGRDPPRLSIEDLRVRRGVVLRIREDDNRKVSVACAARGDEQE